MEGKKAVTVGHDVPQEKLLAALKLFYQNLKQFTRELLRQVEGTPGDCRQKIRALVQAFFELAEEKPMLFAYLLLGEHTELKKFPQEDLRPKDILIQLIEEGQEVGVGRVLEEIVPDAGGVQPPAIGDPPDP